MHENSSIGKLTPNDFSELIRKLKERNPFHWQVDFGGVLENRGFDVVVGNPPYIEDNKYNRYELKVIKCTRISRNNGKMKHTQDPLLYLSNNCGNTHAYFIERSLNLLKSDGRFGFIVPVSLVSTERMDGIRKIIHSVSSEVTYFNFDDRPSKIFSGIEHCRSTIVVTNAGMGAKRVATSKFQKWCAKDRVKLLKSLRTVHWNIPNQDELIPKIGTNIEKDIIKKIRDSSKGKTIYNALTSEGTNIWYYNATSNWIHAHMEENVPKTEYYKDFRMNGAEIVPQGKGLQRLSSHYKALRVDSNCKYIVNGLLNTSLFYWWFVTWSDGRDLLKQHITSFPIDLNIFPDSLKQKMACLVTELMQSYDDNSNIRLNTRKNGTYCISIKEIIPNRSKAIIDQIDDLFAVFFRFTDKEKNFIKNFDLKFRTNESSISQLC